jgi:hypothetical protein
MDYQNLRICQKNLVGLEQQCQSEFLSFTDNHFKN